MAFVGRFLEVSKIDVLSGCEIALFMFWCDLGAMIQEQLAWALLFMEGIEISRGNAKAYYGCKNKSEF